MLQGLTDAEIAATLGRSRKTVETHMNEIRSRFGVRNSRELMIELLA